MQICVNARKGHQGHQGLKSPMIVSCHMGSRNEPRSSRRTTHALIQIPKQCFLMEILRNLNDPKLLTNETASKQAHPSETTVLVP